MIMGKLEHIMLTAVEIMALQQDLLIPQNNVIVQNQNSADCDQDHDHSKDNNGHGSQGALGNYNQNKQNQKDVKLE